MAASGVPLPPPTSTTWASDPQSCGRHLRRLEAKPGGHERVERLRESWLGGEVLPVSAPVGERVRGSAGAHRVEQAERREIAAADRALDVEPRPRVARVALAQPFTQVGERQGVRAAALERADRDEVIYEPAERVGVAAGELDERRHRVGARGDVIGQAQRGRHRSAIGVNRSAIADSRGKNAASATTGEGRLTSTTHLRQPMSRRAVLRARRRRRPRA